MIQDIEKHIQKIIQNLLDGKEKISVYGLGHVGLPMALVWLRRGVKVLGVDIDKGKVDKINRGESPLMDEETFPGLVKRFVMAGKFKATVNGVEASKKSVVKIVTVPTWLDENRKCNLSALKETLKSIGKGLKLGDTVIVEPTVPPTTTKTLAKETLEKESGLKVEDDFFLAYSPERVFIGRAIADIEVNYPKIVGGYGVRSGKMVHALYSLIAKKGVKLMSDSTTAEVTKIFEGIYRDVNIALANELAKLTSSLGLNFLEIREAANSQKYCHLHFPGCGVGGACIPYYPYYAMEIAEKKDIQLRLTKIGREINENMPHLCISYAMDLFKKTGKEANKSSAAVLGLAFRGDVADTRESPSYIIIKELIEKFGNVKVQDPYVKDDLKIEKLGAEQVEEVNEAIKNVDLIVIVTDHSVYRKLTLEEISLSANKPVAVLDGRNIIKKGKTSPEGVFYRGIGV